VQQQIAPVRYEQRYDHHTDKNFLRRSEMRNSQPRPPRDEHDQRIDIKGRQSAQKSEDERIPFPRTGNMSMEKFDRRPRGATRYARQTGEIMKGATRPRQTQPEPGRGDCERRK